MQKKKTGNYNFRKDLAIAKVTEVEVADFLKQKYKADILDFENTNKYDILLRWKGSIKRIEVKEDMQCGDTGNTVLEFESRGKPSGITTSKADYYIYKLHRKPGFVYVMHTKRALLKMVQDGLYTRIVNGGDRGSNTMCYLFKYETFIKTGKIL